MFEPSTAMPWPCTCGAEVICPRCAAGLQIGTRVRLVEKFNWLSKYEALSRSRRTGTIVSFPRHDAAEVEFDVLKRGAKAVTGCFSVRDLVVRCVLKTEQLEVAL
jgi:hypothetical protein